MISLSTAKLFAAGAAEGNKSKYYLHNIILGILGKTGGIPWIIKDILYQVMYLSQLHVGSTHKTRLPITTEYADKMCKNREFIPDGILSNRLFFL